MAKSGDFDTAADALSYLIEAGAPDKAASCLRRIMARTDQPAPSGNATPLPLDYAIAGKIINRLIELNSLSEAQDLIKFLLVARDTDRGRGKMLDCYDVSFILGYMVPEGASESAGRVLFALYSSDSGDDSAASQTLVPFILGTLLDHDRLGWAAELAKQLMYTTLEVWYGRADWAARLCVELESQRLDWFSTQDVLRSVTNWGDQSYSSTIYNFMQEARGKAAGR
ncbi:hypothetical protein GPECTOR_2g1249 [Gonium pectorale]|uniref:Uncharacterized protein n=1 Tax=Gonium pectorale TaxID=33097 RepID=A0A150H0P8_GONPE|nr:hypothetical protein GPECTOR_2g1249 [Gonium pectorale]|eukprot:KXZ55699.1 hypothetical protein GPECTOR_2g1249 [Gonium pectorale]